MNTLQMARTAYAASANPIRTHRGTEYEAFARVTHRLKSLSMTGRENFAALAAALHDNRRLWTLLATDVADADNGLPQQLRAQIFYLAEFTLLHTSKVLRNEASADALVEINAAIMAGLNGERSAA